MWTYIFAFAASYLISDVLIPILEGFSSKRVYRFLGRLVAILIALAVDIVPVSFFNKHLPSLKWFQILLAAFAARFLASLVRNSISSLTLGLSGKERGDWLPGQDLEFNIRFLRELEAKGLDSLVSEEHCAIVLRSVGNYKIQVIKALRDVFALDLKDASTIAKSAPRLLITDVDMIKANAVKTKLESVGAKVILSAFREPCS